MEFTRRHGAADAECGRRVHREVPQMFSGQVDVVAPELNDSFEAASEASVLGVVLLEEDLTAEADQFLRRDVLGLGDDFDDRCPVRGGGGVQAVVGGEFLRASGQRGVALCEVRYPAHQGVAFGSGLSDVSEDLVAGAVQAVAHQVGEGCDLGVQPAEPVPVPNEGELAAEAVKPVLFGRVGIDRYQEVPMVGLVAGGGDQGVNHLPTPTICHATCERLSLVVDEIGALGVLEEIAASVASGSVDREGLRTQPEEQHGDEGFGDLRLRGQLAPRDFDLPLTIAADVDGRGPGSEQRHRAGPSAGRRSRSCGRGSYFWGCHRSWGTAVRDRPGGW
ncbi:hypothetical protein [Kitasatospora cineracea]|uniref:hypothetical protein n=1 Tax=Kitasatospora cineracea TaxID=88074 RepID=UPI0037A8B3BA